MTERRPTHDEIAARAYMIYVEHGCRPGHDVDDWLQAEYELLQLPTDKLAKLDLPASPKGKVKRKSVIEVVRAAMV